jgi:squalene synthase HpnC
VEEDRRTGIDVPDPADAPGLIAVAARAAAQRNAENFPVALWMLPRHARAHLVRLYTYARFVDDVGDEAPGDRLALLDLVERDVRALWTGTPVLPVVAGLRPVIDECAIPIEALLDLIEANRVDQRTRQYQTFGDLVDYCRLSAAPVGRLVLHLAGQASEQNLASSDQVCTALQVLEHCQDVGEDARAGRVYLPQTDLHAGGATAADLLAPSTDRRVRDVVALQVGRARELLRSGPPLVRRLPGWSKVAVAGYVAGGLATAHALERADFDVLARPVRPSRARTARDAIQVLSPW